ncbi:winged helix-turn-helix transcriptional regulator [Frankia sp. CiP1_Cm_nod2]|uniref:winged helix-turn-helix transcriptional regulator n=1 Tax=Frankia sp. CiP1_Cm_nod2 TaxID=2897161 RepID=UPI0040449A71
MAMRLVGPLQDRDAWAADACSAARTLDILATKASFLVVRELFYGTTRFDDFVRRVGVAAPTIARALSRLEGAGVIARTPYRTDGHRARDEYRLTEAGEELLPVIMALVQWGDAHLQPDGPPLQFHDVTTRQQVRVALVAAPDTPQLESRQIQVAVHSPAGRAN